MAIKQDDRLKDIELFWSDTGIIPTREAAVCYAKKDIGWLSNRVKHLAEGLEMVARITNERSLKELCLDYLEGFDGNIESGEESK